MSGHEGAELDEARLLGAESGNPSLNLGIAAYNHGDRLYCERSGGSLERG